MALPKVLLVEDDSSIARFVELALEELPIELVICTSVPAAMQTLHQGGVRLILTDLMLPGESGVDLMQRLEREPVPAPKPLVAVFSAGLTPAVQAQLAALKVWRLVAKPSSVAELESCVQDALSLASPAAADRAAGAPAPAGLTADEQLAVATHFAGDEGLFKAYRASCLRQFAADVHTGDAACAAADWQALRRLAHSLATVLLTLGHPAQSALARQIEDAAAATPVAAEPCAQSWLVLRAYLAGLQA